MGQSMVFYRNGSNVVSNHLRYLVVRTRESAACWISKNTEEDICGNVGRTYLKNKISS